MPVSTTFAAGFYAGFAAGHSALPYCSRFAQQDPLPLNRHFASLLLRSASFTEGISRLTTSLSSQLLLLYHYMFISGIGRQAELPFYPSVILLVLSSCWLVVNV